MTQGKAHGTRSENAARAGCTNIGHYQDTFRKIDGSWLLATRALVLPFGGPTERLDSPARS